MASTEEAQNLASYIRIGSLSLELTELRSSVVAAQLGEEAIATSVKAGAIGLVIVMLIMIIAYRIPGLVASVALVLYTTLMLITLNAFDITLRFRVLQVSFWALVWRWMPTLSSTPESVRKSRQVFRSMQRSRVDLAKRFPLFLMETLQH